LDEAGHARWYVTIKVPLRGKNGAIVGIAGMQRDVTRKKRDEQTLREQEVRLLAAQQIGHLGSFELELIDGMDPELCPMRCSTELLRIAGFEVHDAGSGRTRPNIFRLVDREDWERTRTVINDAIRDGKPYALDFRILCPDGTGKALQGAGDVIRDSYSGKSLRLQGTIHDITDRKRAEEQFAEANANLAQRLEELQRRSNEMHLLSEMGGWLQSCNSIDEAFAAIGKSVSPLFPGWVGALYAIGASRNIVQVVAEWGSPVLGQRVFEPEDCWALRRIRIHRFNAAESSIHCGHVDASLVGESLCVPLMAHGETFGILHLQPLPEPAGQIVRSTPRAPADQKLAAVLAEQIGLALGNLKLRETLRNQSVRATWRSLWSGRSAGPTATGARSPSSWWTSITSRDSTTRLDTRPGTPRCARWGIF
jgi:PAS domain S-box-containing protein